MVGSNGEVGNRGRKNAAPVKRMGAVSPAARSSPRITPVRIPGSAWGNMIRQIVCQRVAPKETLTTRNSLGTDRKASSQVLMMTGNVMIERVREADRMLVPNFRNRTNKPNPKRPYTTEGIPARLMIAIRITLVQRLSGAYSAMYIPAAIPKGTENIAVPMVSQKVPMMAGRIPPWRIPSFGNVVKKFHDIAGAPRTMM